MNESDDDAIEMFVYSITNISNGTQYIGITNNIAKRWTGHRCAARMGGSMLISRALRKYGTEAFRFEVILRVKGREAASDMEKALIAERRTLKPHGYNLTPGGYDGCRLPGWRHSAPTKALMSRLAMGWRKTPEHRAALSRSHMGKVLAPDHAAKVAKAGCGNKGKVHDFEQVLRHRIFMRQRSIELDQSACDRAGKKWRARLSKNGRMQHVGIYTSEEAARQAWRCAAREHLAEMLEELQMLGQKTDPEKDMLS